MKALIVRANSESPEEVDIVAGLKTLQDIVDGPIEAMPIVLKSEKPYTIYVNEEGKVNGLPPNRVALDVDGIYGDEVDEPWDIIFGDFVIVGADEDGGDCDLDSELSARFMDYFTRISPKGSGMSEISQVYIDDFLKHLDSLSRQRDSRF